nr:DUF4229 domain-containing protein [Frigoribacterium sp. VKM Ac-1396]
MVARPLPSCDVPRGAAPHRTSRVGPTRPVPGAHRATDAHPTDRRLHVVKPWLKYSIVRLGLFAVVLGVLLVLRFDPLWATLIAAVVGFCVSYLFFAPLRRRVAIDLAERRSRPARLDDDSAAEDEALADDEADAGHERRPDDQV